MPQDTSAMPHDSIAPAPPSPVLGIPPVLGIDVCKERLDLAYSDGQVPAALTYDDRGLEALLAMIKQRSVSLVVVESTGGIEARLVDCLLEASIPVARVEPGRVRHFAKAHARLAKTDAIDAGVLALFGQVMAPRILQKRSQNRDELDALVTCRRQLLAVRTEQANRRRLVQSKPALKAIDAVLRAIDKQIKSLDEQIRKLIDSDDDFRDLDRILQSVPGVGVGTSSAILSSLSELGTLHKRELASLLGVAPFNDDSGKREGKRRIRGGRRDVRNVFYMAAYACTKFNPVIKAFYERLISKGKAFKVAIVACMRKLVGYLNAMVKDRITWDQLAVVKATSGACK